MGQEHVTEALSQALRTGRLHHAYLFSGPRGCGKTSSARILAASLNCVHGPTPEPCGECEHCRSVRAGSSMDVIEIDAASHRGIDDAREIRERALFTPASARFKVYVIDEAHQITTDAFNALLKLVEEPPPHLKFVFATTEPEKVLQTIRSRTHHYAFRLVPPQVLRDHLANVCAEEGIAVEAAVLPLVVRAGAGSVRDSLSVLDQLIAGADEQGLTYARAARLLGLTDGILLDEAVAALAARDPAGAFTIVERVVATGHDPRRFAADLLDRLRDLIVLAAVPDAPDHGLLDTYAQDQLERMREQVTRLGSAELARAADLLHQGLVDMRGTASPRLLLELILARILLPGATSDLEALLVRLERLERRLSSPIAAPVEPAAARPAAATPPASATPPPTSTPSPTPAQEPPAAAEPASDAAAQPSRPNADVPLEAVREIWPEVLQLVRSREVIGARAAWALLCQGEPRATKGGPSAGGTELVVGFTGPNARNFTNSAVARPLVEEALAELLGGRWQVRAEAGSVTSGASDADASAPRRRPDTTAGRTTRSRPPEAPANRRAAPAPEESTVDLTDDSAPTERTPAPPPDPISLLQRGLGARVVDDREH